MAHKHKITDRLGGRHPRSAPPRATRPARPRRQADRVRTGGPCFLTIRPRARTARQAVGTLAGVGEGVLPPQPACDPGASQSARPRCVGAAQACRAAHVAGREAPPRPFPRRRCFSKPHPRPAHAVLRRHIGRLHPGIAVEERPLSQIHRIGTHRSSGIGARRSTTTAPGSTRPL